MLTWTVVLLNHPSWRLFRRACHVEQILGQHGSAIYVKVKQLDPHPPRLYTANHQQSHDVTKKADLITFGARLPEAGCDAFTIAQLLGHSDVRVTMCYVRAVETSKRVAVAAVS